MQVLRLYDSSGSNIIDSVALDYEDSFCLETFEDLCKAHMETEPKGTKGFIVARVQTLDIKQPDKIFYSYYNAFHLNKILFQTQVYLGKKLIHRLHVLNPLTNTDIIGHVQYFLVKKKDSDDTIQKAANTPGEVIGTASMSSPSKTPTSFTSKSSGIGKKTNLKIETGVKRYVAPASASVKEVEQGKADSWTFSAPAAVMLQDEEMVDCSSPQTAQAGRKLTLIMPKGSRRETGPSSAPLLGHSIPRSVLQTPILGSKEHQQQSNAINLQQTVTLGQVDKNKAIVQRGQLTRYAKPISQQEAENLSAPTSRTRRRLYSLANVRSATSESASYQEWLLTIQSVVKQAKSPGAKGESPSEQDDDFDAVPRLITPIKEEEEGEEEHSTMVTKSKTEEENRDLKDSSGFDAVLFATDTDFLEQSKIRAIFRANAISPEDAALFEMPEYTGSPQELTPIRIIMDDPIPCDFCYPTQSEFVSMPAWKRFLHQYKCYFLVLLIMGVLFAAIFIAMRRTGDTQ